MLRARAAAFHPTSEKSGTTTRVRGVRNGTTCRHSSEDDRSHHSDEEQSMSEDNDYRRYFDPNKRFPKGDDHEKNPFG